MVTAWGSIPVWSSDGRWIVFTSDHGGSVNLWRVAADGGAPERVTVGAGSDYSPDLSRDLRRLIYANGRNTARIQVFDPGSQAVDTAYERRNLATGEEHELPRPLYDPLWTADGEEIYGATWPQSRIYFCAAVGSGCREVAEGWRAQLSDDGRTLYALRGDPPVVWKHELATGEEEELVTVDPYDANEFGWGVTPEGEIVFHTQDVGERELWLGEAEPSR